MDYTKFNFQAEDKKALQQQWKAWIQQFSDFTGITDYMRGQPYRKETKSDPDVSLKREMSRVLLDIAGGILLPFNSALPTCDSSPD